MDYLASALQFLKGVGPRRAADLQRVGLHTIEDLLYRFPIRYEDRGHFQTIASLRPGVTASIVGEVVSGGVRPTRRPRFRIFELLVRDGTGSLRAIWFNQPFLADVFHPHQRVILFGKLELTLARAPAAEPAVRGPRARRADGRRRGGATTTRCTPAGSSRSTRRPAP